MDMTFVRGVQGLATCLLAVDERMEVVKTFGQEELSLR